MGESDGLVSNSLTLTRVAETHIYHIGSLDVFIYFPFLNSPSRVFASLLLAAFLGHAFLRFAWPERRREVTNQEEDRRLLSQPSSLSKCDCLDLKPPSGLIPSALVRRVAVIPDLR